MHLNATLALKWRKTSENRDTACNYLCTVLISPYCHRFLTCGRQIIIHYQYPFSNLCPLTKHYNTGFIAKCAKWFLSCKYKFHMFIKAKYHIKNASEICRKKSWIHYAPKMFKRTWKQEIIVLVIMNFLHFPHSCLNFEEVLLYLLPTTPWKEFVARWRSASSPR